MGKRANRGDRRRSGERAPIRRERKWAIGEAIRRTGADLHIKRYYELSKEIVVKELQTHRGAIHLTTDVWTASNRTNLLALTIHRYKDGVLQQFLLDLIPLLIACTLSLSLDGRHTGDLLVRRITATWDEFKTCGKVITLSGDTAEKLEDEVKCITGKNTFLGKYAYARCLGHVLNLLMLAMYSLFLYKRGKGNDVDEEEALFSTVTENEVDEGEDDADAEALLNQMDDILHGMDSEENCVNGKSDPLLHTERWLVKTLAKENNIEYKGLVRTVRDEEWTVLDDLKKLGRICSDEKISKIVRHYYMSVDLARVQAGSEPKWGHED
ncbi:hypothetical protein BT69DRAFT_1295903 [Atractiella rhizophila]|nr:hypothetical protein BT69DRAFT_1295903 [Atractiella rhizophila]